MWSGYGKGKKVPTKFKAVLVKRDTFPQNTVMLRLKLMLAEQSTYCAYKRREISVPSCAKALSMVPTIFKIFHFKLFESTTSTTHGQGHGDTHFCAHTHSQYWLCCGCKVTPSIDKSRSCDSLLTAQTNIKLDGGVEQKTIKRPFFLTLLFNHGQIAYDSTSSCFVFIFPHLIKRVKSYFGKYFTSPHTVPDPRRFGHMHIPHEGIVKWVRGVMTPL